MRGCGGHRECGVGGGGGGGKGGAAWMVRRRVRGGRVVVAAREGGHVDGAARCGAGWRQKGKWLRGRGAPRCGAGGGGGEGGHEDGVRRGAARCGPGGGGGCDREGGRGRGAGITTLRQV